MELTSIAIVLSFLVTSAAGSVHCVGMCGGFAVLCGGDTLSSRLLRTTFYHGGRLITYILAGYGASAIAAAVPGYMLGAALLLYGLLLLCGKSLVPRIIGHKMSRLYRGGLSVVDRSSLFFPLLLGLFSTLLPCGWLYLNITVAAASPAPLLMMIAFWVGTLPLMTAWGALSGALITRLGRWFPPVRAALLVGMGLCAILQHLPTRSLVSGGETGEVSPQASHCPYHP